MADTITTMLIMILGINIMLWLGQVAILNINPEGTQFIDCKGTLMGNFEQSGCQVQGSYLINDTNPSAMLPSGETSVSPDTGNIFTDAFTAAKNWLLENTGLGYVVQIMSAPYNFLKALNLPEEFTFAVGSLWYGISLFVIVAWLIGRTV